VAVRRQTLPALLALYTETLARHGVREYPPTQGVTDAQELMPLLFAQQVRFFASIQHWDNARQSWVEAIAPRVVAALHDVAGIWG
jgi:hypothetical protein